MVHARLHTTAPNSVGELDQYEDSTGSVTSAAPRASSSLWPSSSAEGCRSGVQPKIMGPRFPSVSDGLVGEVGEVVGDDPDIDEAHGFLVAGLAEEAPAGPEHDRVDHQPQLVDEFVLQ
jgi:hypothetical protein